MRQASASVRTIGSKGQGFEFLVPAFWKEGNAERST